MTSRTMNPGANAVAANTTTAELPWQIRGIDHIRLCVGNAQQATHFYVSAFGMDIFAYRGSESSALGDPPRLFIRSTTLSKVVTDGSRKVKLQLNANKSVNAWSRNNLPQETDRRRTSELKEQHECLACR